MQQAEQNHHMEQQLQLQQQQDLAEREEEERLQQEHEIQNQLQQQINNNNNNLPIGRRPYHDPNHRHSILQMNVECPNCHALHFISEKLTASSNRNPRFST